MRLYGCNCVFLCAGDEVVILEPAFDLYAAQTVVAGANSCLCVCYRSRSSCATAAFSYLSRLQGESASLCPCVCGRMQRLGSKV